MSKLFHLLFPPREPKYKSSVKHDKERKMSRPTRKREIITRLFLIGPGEVGKTTIIKQMQKLCIEKPDEYECWDEGWERVVKDPLGEGLRQSYVHVVHQNTVKQAEMYGYRIDDGRLSNYANEVMDLIDDDIERVHLKDVRVDERLALKIRQLRQCPAIAQTMARVNEFYLPDSSEYFLRDQSLERMCRVDYIPTEDDMIRLRAPTTAQKEFNFWVRGMRMAVHDMGGQVTELVCAACFTRGIYANAQNRLPGYLTTWLDDAEPGDINFIWFIASLSDYAVMSTPTALNGDLVDDAGHHLTKLDETVSMFTAVCHAGLTSQCQIMLFLNKWDVFEHRVVAYPSDLSACYTNYAAPHGSANHAQHDARLVKSAFDFVARIFSAAHDESRTNAYRTPLFVKKTTAISTTTMDTLFGAVQYHIMSAGSSRSPIA